jgi:sulfite exporter TauE/SafE
MVTGGSFIILVGLFVCFGKQLELSCKCLMPQFAEKLSFFLQSDILEKDVKSAIVLGLIIGLLPCAPLLAVLSYIGLISKSWVSSFWFSFSFGAGTFMSPLILLSIFAGWVPEFLKEKRANYLRIFSFFCGLIIIFLGIQLIGRAY